MTEAPYPPAETPADGDRTSQVPPPGGARYSASASVPLPPNNPPAGYGGQSPSGAFGQTPPSSYGPTSAGQGSSGPGSSGAAGQGAYGTVYGQGAGAASTAIGQSMGQAPLGQAGAVGAAGQARVGGSASVPQSSSPQGAPAAPAYQPPSPPAAYGSPQGYQPQPGGYGQPGGGQQYGGAQYGGGTQYNANQPPFGQAPSGGPSGPQSGQTYGQPAYSPPPSAEPPRGRDKMVPTGGWPYVEQAEPPRKSRKGLAILLVIVAILVVGGVGSYVGLRLATRADVYTVGACVRQDGNGATAVECTAAGAYKIIQIVAQNGTCPDATQPSLLLADGRVACLAPVSG